MWEKEGGKEGRKEGRVMELPFTNGQSVSQSVSHLFSGFFFFFFPFERAGLFEGCFGGGVVCVFGVFGVGGGGRDKLL